MTDFEFKLSLAAQSAQSRPGAIAHSSLWLYICQHTQGSLQQSAEAWRCINMYVLKMSDLQNIHCLFILFFHEAVKAPLCIYVSTASTFLGILTYQQTCTHLQSITHSFWHLLSFCMYYFLSAHILFSIPWTHVCLSLSLLSKFPCFQLQHPPDIQHLTMSYSLIALAPG